MMLYLFAFRLKGSIYVIKIARMDSQDTDELIKWSVLGVMDLWMISLSRCEVTVGISV